MEDQLLEATKEAIQVLVNTMQAQLQATTMEVQLLAAIEEAIQAQVT